MPSLYPGPYLTSTPRYDSVHEFQSTEDLQGGTGQIDNWPSQALANRDDYILQFLNQTMLFSKINIYHAASGYVGWSGNLSASDSGSIWIMEPGGIDPIFNLPLFSSVADNYVVGFWQPNAAREGNAVFLVCAGGDSIMDRSSSNTPQPSLTIYDGGVIIKKSPGSVYWEVISRFDRDAGSGTICLRPTISSGNYAGWIPCNGISLSTSQYSELFKMIGYSFGGSGGSFNVPTIVSGITGVFWAIHT